MTSYSVRSSNGAEYLQRGTLALARKVLEEARDSGDEAARIFRDDPAGVVIAPFGVDDATGTILPDSKGRYYLEPAAQED